MFTYDTNGFLKPYRAIQATLEEFKMEFAWNAHRRRLFDQYLEFLAAVKTLSNGSFFMWLNGSFVSKKEFPGDIDLVVFISHERYKMVESRLKQLERDFRGRLDVSFASVFPEGHKYQNLTDWQKNEYLELYSNTRPHPETGFQLPKGFVQINF